MPHHHRSKLETLGLLLGLLPNHYPHQCSYSHCRCRCHQRRTTQIDTINKQKRTPRRVSGPRYLTETLERNVRERTPEPETNEQRESWNQNDPRLIGRRILEHQVSKKSQRTRVIPTKENSPVRKTQPPKVQDLQTKRQNNLWPESSKLLSKNKTTKQWLKELSSSQTLEHNSWQRTSRTTLFNMEREQSLSRRHIRIHS